MGKFGISDDIMLGLGCTLHAVVGFFIHAGQFDVVCIYLISLNITKCNRWSAALCVVHFRQPARTFVMLVVC